MGIDAGTLPDAQRGLDGGAGHCHAQARAAVSGDCAAAEALGHRASILTGKTFERAGRSGLSGI